VSDTRFKGIKVAILASPDADQSQVGALRSRIESVGGSAVIVPAELAPERTHPSEFGGLMLPDAPTAYAKNADPKAVQLVREFMLADKPVAAIGNGVSLLVAADAVTGRSVASSPALAADVRNAGGEVRDAAVHADEKLITARSAADLAVFTERVLRVFTAQVEERQVDQVAEQSFPASDPPPGPGAIGVAGSDRGEPDLDDAPDVRL
jgi:putative intracellular protease/amidase